MRRRTVLRAGAMGAGLALLPESVQRALAMEAPTGGLEVVEHVVIVMQENRGFDHYYGSLRGVRGFNDPTAVRLPSGQSVFYQPCRDTSDLEIGHPDGYVLPYHVDDQQMAGTPHGWGSGHDAWNNGRYDEWVPNKYTNTMSGYRRENLPFYYALAEAFTLCDAYHCSEMGGTNPNRNYLWTGTIGYEPGSSNRAVGNAPYANPDHTGYTWMTYAERLQSAGISWRVYQEWDNFDDNPLAYFRSFVDIAEKALVYTGYSKVEFFYDELRSASSGRQQQLLDELARGVATLTAAERSRYDRCLRRERPGQLAAAFRADVAADRLPAVSWLVPRAGQSEHSTNGPNNGADLVKQFLDGLASYPQVWNKTLFLLNYDENDGFFDHIPPPTPVVVGDGSDGRSTVENTDEIAYGDPIGLGMRVPLLVISPWSRGGNVCSQVFDHTSVLQFLEQWTGVAEPNISPWRRAVCGDLTAALDLGTANPAIPDLPVPQTTDGPRGTFRTPPRTQAMPRQETGIRSARPIPYVLQAHARVSSGAVDIDFSSGDRVGAHFLVYPNAFRTDGPWRYTVEAGKTLNDYWTYGTPTGAYDLTAYGPNGFLRRFAGNRVTATSSGNANPEVTLRYAPSESRIYLVMTNAGDRSCVVTVTVGNRPGGPWTYSIAPGATVEDYFVCGRTNHWYDVTATADTTDGFLRRCAGHMETGQPSTSDPTMGSGPLACTVRYVDSQETVGEDGQAGNAVDGNPATFWHTEWYQQVVPLPHEIQLDLGTERTVTGLTCLPRQDGGVNGRIGQYELYISSSTTSWGSPVTTGVLADIATLQTIRCWPATGRYVRLRALTEAGDRGQWTSAAALTPLGW